MCICIYMYYIFMYTRVTYSFISWQTRAWASNIMNHLWITRIVRQWAFNINIVNRIHCGEHYIIIMCYSKGDIFFSYLIVDDVRCRICIRKTIAINNPLLLSVAMILLCTAIRNIMHVFAIGINGNTIFVFKDYIHLHTNYYILLFCFRFIFVLY